ncbi:spermatogenesis-associated protein 24-like [Mercenaria mercenaria]|uniref:spermatogenesis-associated protein 24-like n=1 Tax=Mercenaria mercenaria TaxID=6596 RepID=UPI00234E5D63|nr:spermatogenesis-associated protein 24-like [Mercenaria mercenaria]
MYFNQSLYVCLNLVILFYRKGALKSKTMQETAKSMKLQSKCSEISRQCELQEDILSSKNSEIKTLEKKLQEQQNLYKKELTEAEIEKKQQRYIAKMMEEQERKNSRGTHQAVPKTKSFRR